MFPPTPLCGRKIGGILPAGSLSIPIPTYDGAAERHRSATSHTSLARMTPFDFAQDRLCRIRDAGRLCSQEFIRAVE